MPDSSAAAAAAPPKKKRNLPGTPDPEAEVVALSPATLLATHRFVCEVCGKGFQRDQNLQLHRRGHNLPWRLRQRAEGAAAVPPRRRVYVCPEPACVHHSPARALGDLTGIKKHFCRKHGEKTLRCDRCGRRYAVPADLKAHVKTCGTHDYHCGCGAHFTRKDSFVTHRAFCGALAEDGSKLAPDAPPMPDSTADDGGNVEEVTDPADAEPLPPLPVPPPVMPAASATLSDAAGKDEEPESDPEHEVVADAESNDGGTTLPVLPGSPVHDTAGIESVGVTCTGATASTSSSTCTASATSTSVFAGLFTSAAAAVATNSVATHGTALCDMIGVMGVEPSFLCLATGATSSIFPQPNTGGDRPYAPTQPPSTPHMSATALLQKAAQVGATATSSLILDEFRLAAPSSSMSVPPPNRHEQRFDPGGGFRQWRSNPITQLESSQLLSPAQMLSPGLGLGLGYDANVSMSAFVPSGPSPLFVPKQAATLDFLGLGISPMGRPELISPISQIGQELDFATMAAYPWGVREGKPPPGTSGGGGGERRIL